jgi:hypothetical protein
VRIAVFRRAASRLTPASIRRAALVALLVAAAPVAIARGGGHAGAHAGGYAPRGAHHGHSASSRHSSHERAYPGVKRDVHGRIARDSHAKEAFRRAHACPATGKTYGACPGWVVDHVQALKHGGADAPWNMQWQTRAAAKAKDRIE